MIALIWIKVNHNDNSLEEIMTMQPGEVQCTALEKVVFGYPAATAIRSEAERLGARRVFLLVSRSLEEHTDEIVRIREALGDRFAGSFSGIPSHAPRSSVLAAAARASEVDADLIVTVGGGSVTDAGKIMPICMKHGLKEHDDMEPYHMSVESDGSLHFPVFDAPDVRVVSVPTTLSGGEFNPLAGATDEARKLKQGYLHRLLAPVSVILDPSLTRHTPEWLWLSTGVRALDHAMETLGSPYSNDFCDGMAASAIRLLRDGLARVKRDPGDMEGRLRCQTGVWQSMLPVVGGVPMGASHAIGHVLGGTCDVPHGYTSCVMAPVVLAFNKPVNGERQKLISEAFGEPDRAADELAAAFIRDLGMPRTLGEVGVTEADLPQVAEYTMEDLWARTNPRTIKGPEDVMEILKGAV